jgi:hypothetical protein
VPVADEEIRAWFERRRAQSERIDGLASVRFVNS